MQSQSKRLYFIDAVRAFAILMMLQGHFIDALLIPEYRDNSYLAYDIWSYMRGNTAPVFFTISGLIFTYLLLKAKEKGDLNQRILKGINRGLMLIVIGYALRVPFFEWMNGHFPMRFFKVDVLQCIGLSLILIVVFFLLTLKKTYLFSILMLCFGLVIFMTEPLYRDLQVESLPIPIANYFSKSNGSLFPIIPWFGFMAWGAFLATFFYKFLEQKRFKVITVLSYFGVGFILIFFSSQILIFLFDTFDFEICKRVANYNYLFIRLGNVLVTFGIFYLFEKFVKQKLILKIGQKTLSIYVIHFIVLYGSYTGKGLWQFYSKSLHPWEAVFGAILFLIIITFLSLYVFRKNSFFYEKLRQIFFRNNDSDQQIES